MSSLGFHPWAGRVGDFMLSSWDYNLGAILALGGGVAREPEHLLVGFAAAIWAHHYPNRRLQWGCKLASLTQWRLRSFTCYVLGREAGFLGEGGWVTPFFGL